MFRSLLATLVAGAVLLISGCSGGGAAKTDAPGGTTPGGSTKVPKVAFVTNQVAQFWTIAEKGANAAGKDVNAEVTVQMPPNGQSGEQKGILENLLAKGMDGIAVSPIDPANQSEILNQVAANCNFITHDSDAPKSKRLCYIGMDNYKAGRMCGQLVKEAMPEGGKIMIFVGRLEQLNAKQRRQGLIDEVLGRSDDSSRYDEPGTEIKNDKYVFIDTRTDGGDNAKAKGQAEDAIVKYPDLNMMVGLFEYNPPMCLEAVKGAGKLGKIKIVGFDENDRTLQGIIDGNVYGTVVQNPYEYGYQSVKMLAALARGDKSVLPKDGFMDIPARKIKADNVKEFWEKLKVLTK